MMQLVDPTSATTVEGAYLEHFGEKSRADFLTEKVVYPGQTGHSAPKGPVGGGPDPMRSMDWPVQSVLLVHFVAVHLDCSR